MLARLTTLVALGAASVVLASVPPFDHGGEHEHHDRRHGDSPDEWAVFDDPQALGAQHAMHIPAHEEHAHADYFEPKPHYDWHDSVVSHFEQPEPGSEDEHPHFPHPKKPVTVDKTIYQHLESEPNYSRLFKLVNFSSEITSLLNDSSKEVTFFALPDSGFPKRPTKGRKPEKNWASFFDYYNPLGGLVQDLVAVDAMVENAEDVLKAIEKIRPDGDHRKEIEKIVTAILSYHILPEKLSPVELTLNTTFATALSNVHGALGGEALRIRVGRTVVPHVLSINLYSRITRRLFTMNNGAFYTISKGLIPLPPVFDTAYLLQKHFSIFTSAVQHTGLADSIRYNPRATENTSAVTTVFAPTNAAFDRLPLRLRLFLFSPFGNHVLKKLLQYHIVPNITVHTDWILNKTVEASAVEYDSESYGSTEDSEYADFVSEDDEFDDYGPDDYEFDQEDYGFEAFGPRWYRDHRAPHLRPTPRCAWNSHPPPFQCGAHPFRGRERPFAHGPFPGSCRPGGFDGHPPRNWHGVCAPPPPPPHHLHGVCAPPPPRRGLWPAPHPPMPPRFYSEEAPRGPGGRPGRRAPPHPHPHPRAPRKLPHPRLTQNITVTLPTLLTNHSLSVQLLKSELKLPHLPPRTHSGVVVNGRPVVFADGTALNGAIHVVNRLIRPAGAPPKGSPPGRGHGPRGPGRRRRRGPSGVEFEVVDEEWIDWAGERGLGDGWAEDTEENEWEDWEEWLLEWAVKVDHPGLNMDEGLKDSE